MNKKLLIIILILLLIIIGIIFLIFSQKNTGQNKQTGSNLPAETSPTQTGTTQNKSLKDLLGMGVAQKCTFTKNDANTSSSVVIYMDNGHIRGDINSVNAGQTINSHMIIQGSETYVWMDNQKNGFKMAFDPNANVNSASKSQNNSVNPDEKADYNCSGWSADQSVFVLPADIQFSDFSKMAIPSVSVPNTGTSGTGTTDKCAACNYLTGDARTQCLNALGCK